MNRRRTGFAGLLVGMSASVLMQTLIATSLPVIASELGGMSLYSWVFGAYMLASTVTIPLFGKMADRMGRRTMYLAGLSVFLIGSALAGLSGSMAHLVGFRVVQGIGAGALAPAALASVGDLFENETERGKVFGIFGAVQVLANLIGPALGGWVTDHLGWRYAFYVVIPVGAVAAVLAGLGLPSQRQQERPSGALDWQGAGLLGIALCAVLLGLQAIGRGSAAAWQGALATLFGAVVFAAAIRWERRHADPALPIALLTQPTLGHAAIGTLLLGAATHSVVAFIPLFTQGTRGATATGAGAVLVPMMLAAGMGSAISGRLMARRRVVMTAAWLGLSAGFAWLSLLRAGAGAAMAIAPGVLIGLGMGLLLPIFLEMAQKAAGIAHRATASGMIQLARNLGGALGVPLLGIWLSDEQSLGRSLTIIFGSLAGISVVALVLAQSASPRVEEAS